MPFMFETSVDKPGEPNSVHKVEKPTPLKKSDFLHNFVCSGKAAFKQT